jgi:hypothetical protein
MNQVIAIKGRKKEREIAEKVVSFCIQKLMPRMKTLDIVVEFDKIDAYGYCMQEDDSKAREYVLTIKKNLPIFELVGTICHEMIHVKQYARKELRYVNGATMWKKSKISDNVDYLDQPWEKEAYKKEEALTIECLKSLDFLV